MLNACESSGSAYACAAALPVRLERDSSFSFLFLSLNNAGRSDSRADVRGSRLARTQGWWAVDRPPYAKHIIAAAGFKQQNTNIRIFSQPARYHRGTRATDDEVVMWLQFRRQFRMIDAYPLDEIFGFGTWLRARSNICIDRHKRSVAAFLAVS
jgi:hypothetical protein